MGKRQAHDDPPPEVAEREEPRREDDTTPRRRRRRTGPPAAGRPEAPEPAARPRTAITKRSRTRSMNTVPNVRDSDDWLFILSGCPVDVAELRRYQAVHEPREEQIGRVLDRDRLARGEQHRPAQTAEREAEVEHAQGGQQEPRVRLGDARDDLSSSMLSANRAMSTSSSGIAIERIVRGWRSRARATSAASRPRRRLAGRRLGGGRGVGAARWGCGSWSSGMGGSSFDGRRPWRPEAVARAGCRGRG